MKIIDEEVHVNNRHATSRNAFYIDVGKRREKVINSCPLSHRKNCGRKIENGTERVCHLRCGEWSFFILITDVKLPNFYSGYKKLWHVPLFSNKAFLFLSGDIRFIFIVSNFGSGIKSDKRKDKVIDTDYIQKLQITN